MTSPILVALDFSDARQALSIARDLRPVVGGFKVGLELIMSHGPDVVEDVAGLGLPVFVDAKLHDIPNTAAGAASALASRGARWVTVHGAGGKAMVSAAVDALRTGAAGALVVTVLTSLEGADLKETGVMRPIPDQVLAMADLAAECGAEGIVCSPQEVAYVKARHPDLVYVTPGIRPVGTDAGDQARLSTPAAAVAAGADYLVIGRPITRADHPVSAAEAINRSLK